LEIEIQERQKIEEEISNLNQSLEERVRIRTAELEQAIKELEAFSYSVSHDLREPLRAIMGFRQIIDQDYAGSVDKDMVDYLQRMQAASVKMDKLIDDLL
jgi:light-regulated signal transduction histidine kinase (bacteriophytochrome)